MGIDEQLQKLITQIANCSHTINNSD